jgi:hypothetical protein
MHRLFRSRATVWTGVLLAVVLASALAASASSAHGKAHRAAALPVTNGGAKDWIAFDVDARSIGPVEFLSETFTIVSTSTAGGKFTLYHEPDHKLICQGAVGGGSLTRCGVQSPQIPTLDGGYFQMISASPVLMTGRVEVPEFAYAQEANGKYIADISKGTIANLPLIWQAGCPPRAGSGCPVTNLPTNVGVKKVAAKH